MLVAIGVFHGSLGLANTSKAADSLWRSLRVQQCDGTVHREHLMEVLQECLTTSEKGIPLMGDIPEQRSRLCTTLSIFVPFLLR